MFSYCLNDFQLNKTNSYKFVQTSVEVATQETYLITVGSGEEDNCQLQTTVLYIQ